MTPERKALRQLAEQVLEDCGCPWWTKYCEETHYPACPRERTLAQAVLDLTEEADA